MCSLSICYPSSARRGRVGLTALLWLGLLGLLWPQSAVAQSTEPDAQTSTPVIHVPYAAGSPDPARGAIFWFGALNPSSNTANVRLSYADSEMVVTLHIFDRRTIYDEAAGTGRDLTQWDAVTLYVDLQSNLSAPLGNQSYRFDGQLSHWQQRANYQRAYRWQGGWQAAGVPFTTSAGFRGSPNDQQDDRGWNLSFRIPFGSLGLSAPPAKNSQWRMALVLHDRDDLSAAPLADQAWPPKAALDQPASWGRIAFGAPVYTPPAVNSPKTVTLRQGVNNVSAPDAAVGGHSECGAQFNPNFFNGWGDANYAGLTQINIQNQWDVADWPCYSRYYVTFPLASLPSGAKIANATLTMYMFGNAGYSAGDAKPSFIQAARVTDDWNERTLTWNNAPLVLENYSWAVVNPMQAGDPPAKPVTWDVSGAVAAALAAGQPLRLALYSSDGDYHSGKYFWSADAGQNLRPQLTITWGSQGYALSAAPASLVLAGGKTATYQVNVTGLNDGEQVTLEAGPSAPEGLAVTITPQTISAPGGTAVVTVTDRSGQNGQKGALYTVPIQATDGRTVQTIELTALVNGRQVFLPAVMR